MLPVRAGGNVANRLVERGRYFCDGCDVSTLAHIRAVYDSEIRNAAFDH